MKKLLNYFKFQTNEMLFHTLDPYKASDSISLTISLLNRDLNISNEFELYFEGDKMIIELDNHYNYDQIVKILTGIYLTGYSIARYYISTQTMKNNLISDEDEFLKYWKKPNYKKFKKYDKDVLNIKLLCEPKWDDSIKPPKIIYHITDSSKTNEILKNGLLPKSGKKRGFHPHRVYFYIDFNNIKNMSNSLKFTNNPNKVNNQHDILEIDTNNLKSKDMNGLEYDVIFYKDPNSNGIYTYDRISPDNIKLKSRGI